MKDKNILRKLILHNRCLLVIESGSEQVEVSKSLKAGTCLAKFFSKYSLLLEFQALITKSLMKTDNLII